MAVAGKGMKAKTAQIVARGGSIMVVVFTRAAVREAVATDVEGAGVVTGDLRTTRRRHKLESLRYGCQSVLMIDFDSHNNLPKHGEYVVGSMQ